MSLLLESVPVPRSFAPEACPYETVMVDITHRCNMACRNCYIPNRTIPDLDARWLSSMFARLPRGTFVRLVGAEPTMREDLEELIRDVRAHGHHPVLLTNGLKLADRDYVRALKRAGLQVVYLSMNGGFDDDLYLALDQLRCAERKRAAFEHLRDEHLYTSIGMIVVPGVNEQELPRLLDACRAARNVREVHLRTVGAMGRYMRTATLTLAELTALYCDAAGVDAASLDVRARTATSVDFRAGRRRVQLTIWPDSGSTTRGRLTPEGLIAPAMEHAIANEGGY